MTPTADLAPDRRARRVFRALAAAGAATTLLAAGLVSAAPSQANIGGGTGTFSAQAGVVGVPQVVTFTLTSGSIANGTPVAITATGTASAQAVTAATVNFVSGQQGSFVWTPPHVGTWSFCNPSFTCTGTTFINQVGVTTSVTAANVVQVGVPTTITATVAPQLGSTLAPLGQVQFSIVGGSNVGPALWLNGRNPSTAQIQWTPSTLGAVQFVATYTPWTVNGVSDTTCGGSCTSAPDTIQVTANGASFWLSNPGTLSQGATATLQAVVGVVPPTGSVSFTINGAPIATNVPVNAQGIAQTRWTPPAPGNFTLAASWVGNGGQQGSASEVLNVSAAPAVSDTIVVRDGSGNVLNPATPVTVANGVTVPFTTQTSSGAAVQLTETGPCQLNGNTLTATQGNGQCRVTAASPGGNGYGPATAVYTVSLVPGTQVPNTNVPVSGRVNRNTTITLERGNRSGTNANQDISWRVTEGRNVCQLRFPSNGNVNLRTVRSGTCTVRGTAPAVAGQWNRMVINRTYRVR